MWLVRIELIETTIKTDVVIIGAGPTGLSLACQFVRYGIDFVVVEKNEGLTPYSKAIGVQGRTLEIYEQIGLAQKAVGLGRDCRNSTIPNGNLINDRPV